jgi:2-hydroxychromene-2-carboxylate isomerase
MWRDMERLTHALGVHFTRPSVFPRNGLLAARVAVALVESRIADFVPKVYEANFARDEDIAAPEVIGRILSELGLEPDQVLALAQSPTVKALLRENTENARAAGIFGSPSFTVKDELFWGSDRLDSAVAWAVGGL